MGNFISCVVTALEEYFLLNPFQANATILSPLKTPDTKWFTGAFRGDRKCEYWSEMG